MDTICCLAGIGRTKIPAFAAICSAIDPSANIRVARLDVLELGKIVPALLVCDVDAAVVDPLEFFRRLRFVLPECTIAAYTGNMERSWGAACHLAGVSGVLAKISTDSELASGIRETLDSGCYTDPRFATSGVP